MCLKYPKKRKRAVSGEGYKVFTLGRDGVLRGDWTGDKERPVGVWLKAKDFEPELTYSGRVRLEGAWNINIEDAPKPSREVDIPKGFSVFLTKKDAKVWLHNNSYARVRTKQVGTAVVRKVKFRKSGYTADACYYTRESVGCISSECAIADEIFIMPEENPVRV